MATISGRRRQVHDDLDLTSEREERAMNRAIEKEQERQQRKIQRQMEIEQSSSYQLVSGTAKVMDKYFLDAILGFVPAIGDAIGSVCALPFIYVALFKVRSIPLTLAVIYYNMLDVLIGLIPFWIGNVCDFFHRANLKNFHLIRGFVEDDKEIIQEVNRKATFMGVMIVVLFFLIYLMVSFVVGVFSSIGAIFS